MLVDLTGELVLVEDVPVVDEVTGEQVLVDQWSLQYDVDGVPAEPLLLDVGTDEWLAEPSVDLNGDGTVASHRDELVGLLGVQVELTVEGTDPAVVRAINGAAYLLPEE